MDLNKKQNIKEKLDNDKIQRGGSKAAILRQVGSCGNFD